ncbi:MAG: hypothetical protein Aurels2KO_36120 [Aureliella sp.]
MSVQSQASIFICAVLVVSGCSSGVQEDRNIAFSSSGSQVAFQHGDSGVFLSDAETGKAETIYSLQPGEIVASAPQFSSDDSIAFAVASLDSTGEYDGDQRSWDAATEGRRFFAAPTKYKCMLRASGSTSELQTLFEAKCDHTGYVAANLALRWHPNGKSIWYIDSAGMNSLAIFEYTISNKSVRRITDFDSSALAFDFSPAGQYVACAALLRDGSNKTLRLSSVDEVQWKELPHAGLAGDPTAGWLHQLSEAIPHFSADDSTCVYETRIEATIKSDQEHPRWMSQLVHYDPAKAISLGAWESEGDIKDIHWHPNGEHVAFVDQAGDLQFVSVVGASAERPQKLVSSIRRFAGFSSHGDWISYTVALPADTQKSTYLFSPVDRARDRLFVAAFDSQDSSISEAAPAIDAMRVTFPHWSRDQAKLSLWATYAPSHASRLSTIVPWSLRSGDPAAVVSAADQEITWMPINPVEEAQVGHYYLLHRNDEAALQWYSKSIDKRELMEPIKLSQWQLFQQQTIQLQDATLFEYICLVRLGENTQAQRRLELFNEHFVLDVDDLASVWETNTEDAGDKERRLELAAQVSASLLPLLKAAYITEVYLSLDAIDEGITFFTKLDESQQTPWQRYANSLCQSHLILSTGDKERYADFVLSELVPAFEALDRPDLPIDGLRANQPIADSLVAIQQAALRISAGLAIAPLASVELTESLSPATLAGLEQKLDAMLAFRQTAHESSALLRLLLSINIAQSDARAEQLRQQLEGKMTPLVDLSNWMTISNWTDIAAGADRDHQEPDAGVQMQWTPAK